MYPSVTFLKTCTRTLLCSKRAFSCCSSTSPILPRFQNGQQVQALELGIGPSDTTKGNVSALVPLESLTDTFTGITLSLMATTRPNFSRQFLRSAVSDTKKDLKCCQLMIQCYPRTNCIHATRDLVRPTTHIRKMLQPDVVICPVELTRWSSSELMVWGGIVHHDILSHYMSSLPSTALLTTKTGFSYTLTSRVDQKAPAQRTN
ncbi:uncharacterized protein N7518_007627 [Penicillium psychrosexuale]|uniref:uncharacterized protein n=1 Tax=Penicillium psychrosexuale TaxID=1002107 RepID=UPI0025456F61|nr:uncharacterized protein N7518_007627 [Penicillium psychrosexuale]KAJ5790616.1 hypothetical protein N7518_007627 [Penicillium psychrosexuale]